MTGKTTIEWTSMPGFAGAVWNPTTGCTRVSAGCDNCYAFALHDKRYATNLKTAIAWWEAIDETLRPGMTKKRDAAIIGQARAGGAPLPWPKQYDLPFSHVQLLPERLDAPLHTRKPTCYFVDSMSDLFHKDVPDEYLHSVFSVMEAAVPRHRFLILTKRPERMREYLSWRWGNTDGLNRIPSRHIWIGTSVEDQASADERIPHLLSTPAAVRFLSCEPLLGPVDLTSIPCEHDGEPLNPLGSRLHWVIVGGESGPRARPMDLAWARSLVAQCRAAAVAPFVKQLGAHPFTRYEATRRTVVEYLTKRESHGRDMAEWPEDLRVREWPR